jgi:hypothetical protein
VGLGGLRPISSAKSVATLFTVFWVRGVGAAGIESFTGVSGGIPGDLTKGAWRTIEESVSVSFAKGSSEGNGDLTRDFGGEDASPESKAAKEGIPRATKKVVSKVILLNFFMKSSAIFYSNI